MKYKLFALLSLSSFLYPQSNQVSIKYTNSPLTNPTQIDYTDILGKDALLNNSDIAKSLQQIPGFSVAKKGGGGTEAFFRSLGGGRLPIIVNGGTLLGGCGGRMDTTLTYIFPQNYNSIEIIKGPQDVRFGSLITGGMLFDREILTLNKPSFNGGADMLYGSFGRIDANTHLIGGNEWGNLQAIYSNYRSDDYKNGEGAKVHSKYKRQSGTFIGALTPSPDLKLELSLDIGRGEAAYADRAMDARTFDRESYQAHLIKLFGDDALDFHLYHHEIDHIMDNFSLTNGIPKIGNKYQISNPNRTNTGARLEYQKKFELTKLYFGGNYNLDKHKIRSISNQNSPQDAESILNNPYSPNYTFKNYGIFTQMETFTYSNVGYFAGLRGDRVDTTAHKQGISNTKYALSGFGRIEKYLGDYTLYTGLGYAQRIPDFWEVSKKDGLNLNKEKNTQLDLGISYQKDKLSFNVSGYASYIKDYIILNYNTPSTTSFNTDALLLGGEAEISYEFLPYTFALGQISYTYGKDTKENRPLAQIAPLQSLFALKYDNNKYFIKGELIAHAKQTRSLKGYGNVVGQDFGDSSGFGILNFYAGYTYKNFKLFAGVENITNKLYSYHLSKNSIELDAVDNPINSRVYEMGRNFWLRAKIDF